MSASSSCTIVAINYLRKTRVRHTHMLYNYFSDCSVLVRQAMCMPASTSQSNVVCFEHTGCCLTYWLYIFQLNIKDFSIYQIPLYEQIVQSLSKSTKKSLKRKQAFPRSISKSRGTIPSLNLSNRVALAIILGTVCELNSTSVHAGADLVKMVLTYIRLTLNCSLDFGFLVMALKFSATRYLLPLEEQSWPLQEDP